MRGFYQEDEKVWLKLDEVERALLASLISQLVQLLKLGDLETADPLSFLEDINKKAVRPQDEVVFRLLPDAYADDEESNNDFRKFTEQSLRDEKLATAKFALANLPEDDEPKEILDSDISLWLKSLNDVRLALGTRLEITDGAVMVDQNDEEKNGLLDVYDWLTWLQGTLLEII
jgi:hypothetical protein